MRELCFYWNHWRGIKPARLIDEELVCRVQGLITAEQHQKPGGRRLPREQIGKYRKIGVRVGDRKCPSPESVPEAMESLVGLIRWWQKKALARDLGRDIRHIADFHFYFEIIHPFVDGNGRTGRALVWYLFRYAGIKPFIFTSCDKYETYYLCFEDRGVMRRYFMKKMGFGVQTQSRQ